MGQGYQERTARNWWLGVLAIVLALAVWQFVAAVIIRYPFILPAPTDVLSRLSACCRKGAPP